MNKIIENIKLEHRSSNLDERVISYAELQFGNGEENWKVNHRVQ